MGADLQSRNVGAGVMRLVGRWRFRSAAVMPIPALQTAPDGRFGAPAPNDRYYGITVMGWTAPERQSTMPGRFVSPTHLKGSRPWGLR